MKKSTLSFLFFLILLLVAGCERTETSSSKKPQPQPGAERTFLIGLIPEQNIFKQMDRYQPLADYLSRKTNTTIRLTVLPRYGNIVDHFVSTGMDGAFFGSFTFALAHEKLGVDVLA
jgi:phosphonate transport system substrate-binding protein